MDLGLTEYKVLHLIHLAQDYNQWRVLLNTTINFSGSMKC
jgi:hypothetical protein